MEENENAPVDVVEQEEITSGEVTESEDDVITLTKAEFKSLDRKARAYDANKTKPQEKINNNVNAISEEDIEIKILKSQGVDSELIDTMKALAKVRGKSVLDIQNDPILVAMKEAREKEVNAQKARLPASKGSSTVKQVRSLSTPGLTDAERKELWRSQTKN